MMSDRPVRCLHVVEAALGGVARHVLDLVRETARSGHEVHLAYSDCRCDDLFRSGLAALRRDCPEVSVVHFPISREVRFSDIPNYFRLSQYALRNGPFDIIHCHSTKAGFIGRLLPIRGARVYTPHALMTLDPRLRGVRWHAVALLERFLSWISRQIICVSEDERECAVEIGISTRRLVVIGNGVDRAAFARRRNERSMLRSRLGVDPGTIAIGYVSRLVAYKAPEKILEAFSRLHSAMPCRLLMIGSGPEETRLRKQADDLGIADRVAWCGEIDAALVFPVFDILAHTSLFEGFGYVFLEALASGVPIVTTKVGGVAEMVVPDETGFVCDPWDADVFARYLQRLADDPVVRDRFACASLQHSRHFSTDRMVEQTMDVYNRVLGQRPRGEPLPAIHP